MRNLSVFGMLCMICTCAFCTPSLRASSIPLNHQPTLAAPKTITATASSTSTDSGAITTTESTPSTNDSRISFTAPIKNSPRYYIPTGNSNSGSNTGNSGNTPSGTSADLAAIQQQIDELLTQQQRFEDSVRTTVQTEIKNSDLTKNASFNDIVSNLQESAPSMTQVNETIDEKISDTLVEKGIVNNRGQLLVATTDEIQPLALSQKLESTLATKFAKKVDVAPAKLAADIATNEAAVQTLAARVGTNESDVKTLIASDLKQRGIINSNNTLNVATKSELPVVDTETVAQALQNSAQFDNMISQNLISKGIYDSNKQLQVLKKNELTPELLTTKLDSTYAKTTDITPEKLSSKLNNIYATKSELPTINEETISAALANSTTLDNSVIKTLKRKNILDSNENLNVATKAELPTEALQQQIDSLQNAQTNLARNQLTRADVASTVQSMDLTTNPDLQTTLTSMRTSNQNLQAAVASVQQKTNNLDANIDTKLRERGLVDNNNAALFASKTEITPEIIAQNIANSNTAKATLSGKLGPNTDTVNALITQKLKDKGLVTDDANANRRVLTSADLETALSGKNYATKSELPTINEDTVSAALANSTTLDNTVIKTLKNKGLLDANNSLNVATKEDVDVVNIADKIAKSTSAKEKLAGQFGASEDDVKAILVDKGLLKNDANNSLNVATKTDLAGLDNKFATKGEAGTSESKVDELITTKLKAKGLVSNDANAERTVLTSDDLNTVLTSKNYATKNELPVIDETTVNAALANSETLGNMIDTAVSGKGFLTNDSDTIKNLATKSDVSTETLASKLSNSFATKGEAGTSESKVNELIITKLKGKGIISNDDKETLQLATTAQLNALDSAVTNLDGDISNPDSLLYKIKHNASIQQDLKGEKGDKGNDGSSVSLSDVTSALKGDQNFLNSVKGKDGTGYTLKGSVETYSELPTTNNTAGDGWYVEQTGLLYVYSCDSNGENCTYPIITKGLPFKGEKGTSFNYTGECGWSSTIPSCIKAQEGNACAHTDGKLYICSCNGENCEYKGTKLKGDDGISPKSVEQQYCENNLAIVQKLYPNNNISSATDCADTSKFSNVEYSAIMGGAKAYCLSLAKDPSVLGNLSNGIGKRLATKLGSTKMAEFIDTTTNNTTEKRLSIKGFTGKTSNNQDFMSACEDKYNEIMAGEDGTDAKSVEQQYCEDNLAIVQKLYPNNNISSATDCADTSKFSNAEYSAIMGGSKAYCLSLTKDLVAGKLSFTSGIGKKLADTLDNGSSTKLNSFKNKSVATVLDKTTSTYKFGDKNFMEACEDNYNAIMSGKDGEDAASPWFTYCSENNNYNLNNVITPLYSNITNCNQFTNTEYTAILGGSKAYCLSLTKDLVAGNVSFTSGIGKKLADTLDNGDTAKLSSFKNKSVATVLDKTTSTYKFGDKNFMETCEEKYNEIMSGEKGNDGVAGDSAAEIWCKAHSAQYTDKKTNQIRTISAPTALPASKGLTAFNALKTKKGFSNAQIAEKIDTTTRIFASVEDCVAAVEADPGIMEGKSEADKEFDDNNTNLTLNDTNVTGLNNFRSGFKETLKGKTASDTWCEANFNKDFSFAKSTRVKAIAGAKLTTNSSTGIGKFATVQDCKDAMNTNENLFAEVLKGESASDQAVNEEFTKADDKSTVISKYGNVTKLSTWATDGFKASLKGDAGTGITYRGSVPTYEDLPATSTVQQGDAYYNEEDGKMYTATCTNNTCTFPAKGQGNQYRGAAGRDGTTYIPEVNASTGMLKWKNTNGDYFDIAAVKVKGEDGDTFTPTYNNGRLVIKNKAGTTIVNEQVKGEDGITYEPNVSAAGVLTWKNSKTQADSGITGVNIKGEKGDNGATFTPTFDSTTGKLSWASDKAGVTLPSEMKIAKTDSELGTLVANKISADTTLAKKDDITGAKLEEALGNRFTKTADVNGLILSDLQNRGIVSTDSTPRALFATASDVTGLTSRTSALETTASKALTTDNLKNSAVVSALNTAGIITSDNADTKLTSFAKTADVVTKTGFSSQLQADLDKNDSTIKTALGNTFAAKGTVDSLSGTIATLTGGEDDTGSIANKIKTAKTTIESGIDTKLTGYATTGTVTDLTTRTASLETNALTTGNLADKLSASNSTVKKAFSDAGFAKTADVVTNNDFKSKLQTNLADNEVKSALATAGFAKTDDVVTKTGFAAQLQSDLNAENSTVKSALATAGFAKTADVVTNNDFKSKLKTNLADSEVKTALSGAGFAQSSEIATTVNNTLNGTGEGSFASRLSNAGVITASNAANTLTGFATSTELASLSNNVVTKNNLATELTSNTAQTALANAGFATKSNITNDVKNDVFTLSDFSRLLSSGGLEVDNTGKLKLADTTTNAAAANINAKLTAAKANDASIQTTGLTATSNITNSIASVAASAAGEGEIKDQATCNKHEYMYWTGSACTKCPDGTYFDASASTRCVCKDSALTFSGGSCIKATMTSDKCSGANGAGMYYTGSTCERCPSGTYFNEASMSNTSLPRCICEDKSLEFNASSGKCTPASSCTATRTVANPQGKCQECPKEFPFLQETGSCACPAGTAFNIYRWGCAECGAAGAEYNEMTKSCTCPAGSGMTLNQEQWKCTK